MNEMNISLTNGYCDVEFKMGNEQTVITMQTKEKTIIQQLSLEDFDNNINDYAATVTELLADFFSDDFVLTNIA